MQKVNLGVTISGIPGYFTNYFLVWSLSEEEFNKSDEWHQDNAKRLGFEFVEDKEE